MRARFAGDDDVVISEAMVEVEAEDAVADKHDEHMEATEALDHEMELLQARISEFKQDSKNMEVVEEFIDEVLNNAELEVLKKQNGMDDNKTDEGVGKLKKAKQHVKKITITAIKKIFEWQDSKEGKDAQSMKNGKKSLEEIKLPTPVQDDAKDMQDSEREKPQLTSTEDVEVEQNSTNAVKDNQEEMPQEEEQMSKDKDEKKHQSFNVPDFKNGKVVNRARGLVVRLFDAICNCTNSTGTPAQRIKLHTKRAASSADGTSDDPDNKELQDEAAVEQQAEEQKLLQDQQQQQPANGETVQAIVESGKE